VRPCDDGAFFCVVTERFLVMMARSFCGDAVRPCDDVTMARSLFVL